MDGVVDIFASFVSSLTDGSNATYFVDGLEPTAA